MVHPLAALPVRKCFFENSAGHWIIFCLQADTKAAPAEAKKADACETKK